MRLVVGTSGFSYTEWRGSFYPEKLPESAMLRAYAERLPSVEINNTFYRMPQAAVLEGWASKVPASFSFALKAPRRITHIGKLKNVADVVDSFFQTARVLGERLGPVLFQLPPTFRKDEAILAEFLALLPPSVRVALEFRHPSWFEESVYARLAERQVALCAAEVDPDEGSSSPFVKTAPFGYVRLRRASYDEASLGEALQRIRDLGVDEAFVYLKHEVLGPSYALSLLAKA
ncbi:MAG TPA: DUF72 domain-containing protein [Polyangiaceae bacterium]